MPASLKSSPVGVFALVIALLSPGASSTEAGPKTELLDESTARRSSALAGCEDSVAAGGRSADLYCIDLIPAPDFLGASGTVELRRVPSPFGVAVTAEGIHLYDLEVSVGGLPDPASLGPFSTYVAWVTTPLLRPVVKLGEVRHGSPATGRVGFDKFMVLVSAESSASVRERQGRLVLRGTSPSMRMQPHEGDPLFLVGVESAGVDRHSSHRGDENESAGWIVPPMHPAVPMPPGMDDLAPGVTPFLPRSTQSHPVPAARPRSVVRLADGATLDLEAGPVRRTIQGRTFTMYGFNGQYPGPLIQVSEGSEIVVNFMNRTALPTAVHWHGVRVENRFDGVPAVTQQPVPPGGSFRYRVRFPDAGIYWYHPHHREDIQQDLGLYGNLRVDPLRRDYWSPVHREEYLMLDDLLIAEEGIVPYGWETATHALNGRFGNVLLVNGEPEYMLDVQRGEIVRFFLTNVASTRTFNLSFGGAQFKVVGSDLGKFEREEWAENVVLAPAERYVVEVKFDTPGEVEIVNRVRGIDHLYGSFFAEVDTLGLIRVGEDPAATDLEVPWNQLRTNLWVQREIDPYRRHFDRAPDHTLLLTLDVGELPFPIKAMMRQDSAYFNPVEWTGTMPMMNWVTTGNEVTWILRDLETGRENMDIDWRFRVGEVVKIRLVNDRDALHAMQHPVHIHGQRFLVLAQNGVPNDNLVWKDTVLVPVGSTVDLLVELSNPGRWMIHCHIAEHLETGMMAVFTVEGADGVMTIP